MDTLLTVDNVSVCYRLGDFKDIGLKEWTMRHLTHNYHVEEFMAVAGVSFTLSRGDLLGIIGTNGAGKSTLLKAVAGIMEPTGGRILSNGSISALLELGSGFDGDLTVKENAYLRGAMLGYTREFMDDTYEQIISFAELEEFQDRPFKQLSSGMQSRLAFSIASLVQPEILILDEVLSVGDGAFQEKSAKKMREIISGGAATILVSHSLSQIRDLCTKVLWLDHGKQVAFGGMQEICDRYQAYLEGDKNARSEHWKTVLPNADSDETLKTKLKEAVEKDAPKIAIDDDFVESGVAQLSAHMQELNYFISPKEGDRILDIGCGPGELSYRMHLSGAKVVGIDDSADAIRIAEKTFCPETKSNLQYLTGDVLQMKTVEKFNKIVLADIVEHLKKDALENLIRKIHEELLSSDGIVVIHTTSNKDFYDFYYPHKVKEALSKGIYLPNNPRSCHEELMHINEQNPASLKEILTKHFDSVKVWTGNAWDIISEKTFEQTCEDNRFFAIAGNNDDALNRRFEEQSIVPEIEKTSAEIKTEADELFAVPGSVLHVSTSIKNNSKYPFNSFAARPVKASYHIILKDGEPVYYDGIRTAFDTVVAPGEERCTDISVFIPEGIDPLKEYILRLTLVAENCFWFDSRELSIYYDIRLRLGKEQKTAKVAGKKQLHMPLTVNPLHFNVFEKQPEMNQAEFAPFLMYHGKSRPLMLICETINSCTNHCIICAYDKITRKRGVMTLETFQEMLWQYEEIGGGYLSLTPMIGEVFLDPLLIERLSSIRQHPKITGVSITTNMAATQRFNDQELGEIIRGLHRIHISVYGLDENEHALMTGRNDFETVVSNMKRVVEAADDKGKIMLGFRTFKKYESSDYDQWMKKNLGECFPFGTTRSYANWAGTLDTTKQLPFDAKWLDIWHGSEQCILPVLGMRIFVNGDVSFCACSDFNMNPELRLGNIHEQSLSELYNSPHVKELWNFESHMPEICRNCTFWRGTDLMYMYKGNLSYPVDLTGG